MSVFAMFDRSTTFSGGCSGSDDPSSISPASMFVVSLCAMQPSTVHVSHDSALSCLGARQARDMAPIVGLIASDR